MNSDRVALFGDGDLDLETPPVRERRPRASAPADHRARRSTAAKREPSSRKRRAPRFPLPPPPSTPRWTPSSSTAASFLVSGHDWEIRDAIALYGNPRVPGVLTTGRPSRIKAGLKTNQRNNVEGKGPAPSVDSSRVDMDVTALAAEWAALADLKLSGEGNPEIRPVTPDRYRIVHVSGDYAPPQDTRGSGILVVDGRFSLTGQFTWEGVVFVNGPAWIQGAGAGTHLYGTLIVSGGGEPLTVGERRCALFEPGAQARRGAVPLRGPESGGVVTRVARGPAWSAYRCPAVRCTILGR